MAEGLTAALARYREDRDFDALRDAATTATFASTERDENCEPGYPIRGSWEDVERAHSSGDITDEQYSALRDATSDA